MSEKFCIFCGGKPEKKNKEHVIPQWLIRMTGREKKDVFTDFPSDYKHLSFMNFTFPACEKCNSKYSELEALTQKIMEKVLSGGAISGAEANVLMDWFDKVRIGLWLTWMCYDPELKADVQPHFFIDSRIGTCDRLLNIRKLNLSDKENKGILFMGTNNTWFTYCPSAFSMVINDYYFLNASTNNLVSPHLGFPIMREAEMFDEDKGLFHASLEYGRQKIINPVVKGFIPHAESVTFFQPMYHEIAPLIEDNSAGQYIVNHSYDSAKGIGGVFFQKGNVNNIKYLQPNSLVNLKMKTTTWPALEPDVLKFQNIIAERSLFQTKESKLGIMLNKSMLSVMTKSK